MLKYLLPIGVVYLILAVIGVILIVREVKKENNKDDMILIIISFLVPLIGLIVYAVNVGKDKHITECALKGLKMYLKFLLAQFIISVIVVLLMIFVFSANTTHKTSVRNDTTINELAPQEIEKKIQSNSYVNYAKISESGKRINIKITFIENITSEKKAKDIAKETLSYFDNNYIKDYDFNFILMTNDNSFEILGYKSNTSNNIVWNN